jgi:hypothetical protein
LIAFTPGSLSLGGIGFRVLTFGGPTGTRLYGMNFKKSEREVPEPRTCKKETSQNYFMRKRSTL